MTKLISKAILALSLITATLSSPLLGQAEEHQQPVQIEFKQFKFTTTDYDNEKVTVTYDAINGSEVAQATFTTLIAVL